MKSRYFTFAAIAVLLLSVIGMSYGDTKAAKSKKQQTARLVSLLPASDGVAVFDSNRFLNDALPKILSANQPVLAEIMTKLADFEKRTGIDVRKLDQVAIGVTIKQISQKNVDLEPLAIAGGDMNAGALISVAKLAANGSYREVKIDDKTVCIFAVKDIVQKMPTKPSSTKIAGAIDKAVNGMSTEVAVTALDGNTLAIGSLDRVRATIEAKTHLGSDIIGLLSPKASAVMSFALKTPDGLSKLLPLDNDELGKNVDAIQYLAGSLDVATQGTSLQMLARTKQAEQANGLKDTIEGLQIVGKAIFGSSKRKDQQIYARLIDSAKVSVRANEVILDLLVPQSDIDKLVAGVK